MMKLEAEYIDRLVDWSWDIFEYIDNIKTTEIIIDYIGSNISMS